MCAGRRPGHQLAILAEPPDELVGNRALDLLTTRSFWEVAIGEFGRRDDEAVARALAELRSAQTRIQTLDDDYYVH